MGDRNLRWIWAMVIFVIFAAYSEADSWFWRSQIRDLQRRIAVLEQERK